jgi:hypothetical protein
VTPLSPDSPPWRPPNRSPLLASQLGRHFGNYQKTVNKRPLLSSKFCIRYGPLDENGLAGSIQQRQSL